MTVIASADEPQTNFHSEEALKNADESDESTGQVELKAFKTKSRVSILADTSTQTVKGLRIPRTTGHIILKLYSQKQILCQLSQKALKSNIKESISSKISREALLAHKSIIVGKKVKVPCSKDRKLRLQTCKI